MVTEMWKTQADRSPNSYPSSKNTIRAKKKYRFFRMFFSKKTLSFSALFLRKTRTNRSPSSFFCSENTLRFNNKSSFFSKFFIEKNVKIIRKNINLYGFFYSDGLTGKAMGEVYWYLKSNVRPPSSPVEPFSVACDTIASQLCMFLNMHMHRVLLGNPFANGYPAMPRPIR